MRAQRGVTVLVCLVMMVLVMLVGASAARLSWQGEQAARGGRDRELAFQAAEDALADAEHDIGNGTAAVATGPCGVVPAWQHVDLTGDADGGACTTGYGAVTGATMQTGAGFLPFKKPRYVIERLDCHAPGGNAADPQHCYRVTAIGFGPKPGTEVVLQSVFIPE
ncbi:MAG: pilus assembly protein [Duganella sp.]